MSAIRFAHPRRPGQRWEVSSTPPREHPFLLFRRTDLTGLRARAEQSPWREMRAEALREAGAIAGVEPLRFDPTAPIRQRANQLSRIFSTTALAYVLDPAQAAAHRARLVAHFVYWRPDVPGNLTAELAGAAPDDWSRSTPTGAAFFNAVLALDVIHDDLTTDERAPIEAWLDAGPGRFFTEHTVLWKSSGYAARGIWALYRGDRPRIDEAKQLYREEIFDCITADGVYVEGPGYGIARWLWSDREHKHYFGDVLAHTGEFPDWYREPKVVALHEWLLGYARTPAGHPWALGDTAGDEEFPAQARYLPGVERAVRLSATAAGFAAARLGGATPPARLCTYVLLREPLPPSVPPTSRIFPDGGAFLRESSAGSDAFAAVLWNPRTARAHNHKEVNAVGLAAYGCQLLRGAGYQGWGAASHGFTWDYVNQRALSGNVVLIDYDPSHPRAAPAVNDHVAKCGSGVAGFTTSFLDYAIGDSGGALPNGHHRRHLIFLPASPDAPGYAICADAVTTEPGANAIQTVWHPDAPAVSFDEQAGTLHARVVSAEGRAADLRLFLVTPPTQVTRHDGLLADWHRREIGQFAVCHYPASPVRRLAIVTVLYPSRPDATPPAFERRSQDSGWVGTLAFSDAVTDRVYAGSGETPLVLERSGSVHAGLVFHRQRAGRTVLGFFAGGRSWNETGFSFVSDHPVDLAWREGEATVRTELTVRIELTGRTAQALTLAPGTHRLRWS